jgi:hypothetical protein
VHQHIQQAQQLVGTGYNMAEKLIITGLVNKCNNWLFIVLIFLYEWNNCQEKEGNSNKKAHPVSQDGLEI